MKSFYFNWLPPYNTLFPAHNQINLNSTQFVTPVNETACCNWYISATGAVSTGNLNLRLILCYNETNKPINGAHVCMEIVNFLEEGKTLIQQAEGNIPAVNQGLPCVFQVNAATLLNEHYTIGTACKRICIKCTLKLFDDDELKKNIEAEQTSAKVPEVVDLLFQSVFDNEKPDPYADICLLTSDNKRFNVHRCFLARQSPVFKTMFESDLFKEASESEVTISDVDSAALIEILRYVYMETVQMDALKTVAAEALYAVEKYMLPKALKNHCHKALKQTLAESNAVTHLQLADTYDLKELKSMAIQTIVDEFSEIRKEEAWINLLKSNPTLVDEVYESIRHKFAKANIVGAA